MRIATVTLNPALDLTVTVSGLRPGSVNAGSEPRWEAGGKGVNVAAFLADYGFPVVATGLLGDANPEPFEALLRRKEIVDAFVRVPGATRVGVKLVDRVAGETTDINLPGIVAPPDAVGALRLEVRGLVASCDAFVLAGSLPPGVAPGIWADLCRELRAAGRLVAVDTSGRALAAALLAAPSIIKPNLSELEAVVGHRIPDVGSAVRVARKLVDGGVELVVVSMGAAGALLVTGDDAVLARPPAMTVGSTVGAGDAMVAGVVAARLHRMSLEDTARLGTAFSIARLGGWDTGPAEVGLNLQRVVLTRPTADLEA